MGKNDAMTEIGYLQERRAHRQISLHLRTPTSTFGYPAPAVHDRKVVFPSPDLGFSPPKDTIGIFEEFVQNLRGIS